MRVIDLRGVDLDTWTFDFDLTLAVLLAHPDGTVYHRLGTRDASSAEAALSEPALARLLREGLATHRARQAALAAGEPAPAARPARTLDDLPVWRKKLEERQRAGQKPVDCYHCHFVFDAERRQALADGTWRAEMIWRWPPPQQVGLELDPVVQERVRAVRAGSPAAKAGLQPDDRLLELSGARVLSWSDVSWALERARGGERALPLAWERAGVRREGTLELPAGWETGDALTLSWRPSKWQLEPGPGFGGRELDAAQKQARGLAPEAFAFQVGYLVTWGGADEKRYGEAAVRAGVRKDDVILGVNGKRDFASHDHFQAWWRLELRAGQVAQVELLRGAERRTVEITIPE